MSGLNDSFKALYLHIPFCASKCAYCDFASQKTAQDDELIENYLHILMDHIRACADAGFLHEVKSAYVGGGTPSMLSVSQLELLISCVRNSCPALSELTLEANPESLTADKAQAGALAGITRFSLGVQSFIDEELKALGRIHSAKRAQEALLYALATGADVSIDLMCAIPKQTQESWALSLRGAIALGLRHVSVYPLSIEEGTAFGRRFADSGPAWNEPEVQAERMEQAETLLYEAGFERYEVASYAKDGRVCAHNICYWTGQSYLGLGSSAASMASRELALEFASTLGISLPPDVADTTARLRFSCTNSPADYAQARDISSVCFEFEELSYPQALAEDLLLYSRMNRPMSASLLQEAEDVFGQARMKSLCDGLQSAGLLNKDLSPTHDGWLRGNEIFSRYFELAF